MSGKDFGTDDPFFMVNHKGIFYPASLKKGDKIAILSPASVVKEEYVLGAMDCILEKGYEPLLMPYALGHESGTFSASKGDRLMDLFEALEDPEIKAILCSRGGYGCCQLLANFSYGMIAKNPKWLIGFSDVSALHAMWYRSDIASIHGPMAKHLATMPGDDPCTEALFQMLENGGRFDYSVAPHKYNREGKVTGILRGGNFAVLEGLVDTPYDILNFKPSDKEKVILFIEDIGEPIYKVNRMLWHLFYSGVFENLSAIIFGQFTEYRPDANYATMEDMINDFIEKNFMLQMLPVVFNFPTGHTDLNYPLTEGAEVELDINSVFVRLRSLH